MVVSGISASLAMVAAPIRKLCLLNSALCNPAATKACLMLATNFCQRGGSPSLLMKSGPGVVASFVQVIQQGCYGADFGICGSENYS